MQDAPIDQPIFNIQRMYLSDASLEIPMGAKVFLETAQPNVEIQLDTSHESLADGVFQVTVRATVTMKVNNNVAFLVEAKQCGIFEIRNFADDQRELVLGIACPSIIYPYLRANIADVAQRSTMPPVHLAEINWEVFYQQRNAGAANGQSPIITQ